MCIVVLSLCLGCHKHSWASGKDNYLMLYSTPYKYEREVSLILFDNSECKF